VPTRNAFHENKRALWRGEFVTAVECKEGERLPGEK
jgi:hypothetical protein